MDASNSTGAQLCLGGCGFFGNARMSGMCSQCFKKAMDSGAVEPAGSSTTLPTTTTTAAVAVAAAAAAAPAPSTPPPSSSSLTPMASATPAADADSSSTSPSTVSAMAMSPSVTPVAPAAAAAASASAGAGSGTGEAAAASATPAGTPDAEMKPKKKKQRKGRCAQCSKRVGLTGFECRCKLIFCGLHRYAEAHECDFDYKTAGREILNKANPTIVADKLDKL